MELPIKPDIQYTNDFEDLLKNESEKAEAMSILHTKASQKYNNLSVLINIPVIILSAVIGFLSPLSLFPNQPIFIGAVSIFIAILKTLDSYFDFTKRTETHRMTSLSYVKISKWLQIQLSLEKDFRIKASDLLDTITNDIENIRNAEPNIDKGIIEEFNLQYKEEKTSKPAICNGLTEVKINRQLNI